MTALVLMGLMAGSSAVGSWSGSLALTPPLRLVVHVVERDGRLSATLDSPDQGASGIAVDIAVEGRRITVSYVKAGFTVEGTLDESGTQIVGQFRQGEAVLPLTLKRSGSPEAGSPTPGNFDEEPVSFINSAAGIRLRGTLTLPHRGASPSPAPAFLLIWGSGPHDRDGTSFGHKPGPVIAEWLATRGYVVLRVDDRGIGGSKGDFSTATSLEFATDVSAAVDFLRGREEVDRLRIGLIGHSEGALVAALVAAAQPSITRVALLAPPGLPGEELMISRALLLLRQRGVDEVTAAYDSRYRRSMFEALARRAVLEEASTEAFSEIPAAARQTLGWTEGEARAFVTILAAQPDWFRFWLSFDPLPVYAALRARVLVVSGTLDQQVPPELNLPGIEGAMKSKKGVDVVRLPGVNHLFQKATTGSPAEYGTIDHPVAPELLKVLGDWLAGP